MSLYVFPYVILLNISSHFTDYSTKTKTKARNFTTCTVGRVLFPVIYYVHATRNTSEVEL